MALCLAVISTQTLHNFYSLTFIIALGLGIRIVGPLFVMTFYALLGVHVYSYYEVILNVLKKRLGVEFGLLWVGIGVCILYNIVFNHFFAMVIKPGSPNELKVSIISFI